MWSLIGTTSRWLLFAGLLAALGAVAFKWAILSRAEGAGGSREAGGGFDPGRAAARVGLLGAGLAAVGAAGRLGAQMAVFRDPFEPYVSELDLLVTGTPWGTAWLGQIGFALLALIGFGIAARGGGRAGGLGWAGAATSAVLLAYTPAFSGHAAGAEHYVTAAISADVFHVVAGGAWLGTLAVMAGVVRAGRRSGQPVSRERIIAWIVAFSPIALGSAAVIGATGLFGAWLHLDAVSSLWSHPYGRRLSLKLLLLGLLLAAGGFNWKRSRGRVQASGHPPRLPKSVALELSLGLGLLLVTAVLVETPPPAH